MTSKLIIDRNSSDEKLKKWAYPPGRSGRKKIRIALNYDEKATCYLPDEAVLIILHGGSCKYGHGRSGDISEREYRVSGPSNATC